MASEERGPECLRIADSSPYPFGGGLLMMIQYSALCPSRQGSWRIAEKSTPLARHISAHVSTSAIDCGDPVFFTTSLTDMYDIFLTSLVLCPVPPLRKSIRVDLILDFLDSNFVSISDARFVVEVEDLLEGEEDRDVGRVSVDRCGCTGGGCRLLEVERIELLELGSM